MDFNFTQALAQLPPGAPFRVANEARPPSSYLFNTLLPERNEWDYQAAVGNMIVRTTMAGLVGMDSPYPEGGIIEASDFSEATAKIAISVRLPERAIRRMQQILMHLMVNQQPTIPVIQTEALNFTNKLIVQPMLDTSEWLRGQALAFGKIDWTFNNKRLLVDYGFPANHVLPLRTLGSNEAYSGTASKFWDDVRAARRLLRRNVRAYIAHGDTIDDMRYNKANGFVVTGETQAMSGAITFRRWIPGITGTDFRQYSDDPEDVITIIRYNEEGEVFDLANPGKTLRIPFMPRGRILAVANNSGTDYTIGAGSTPPIELALGYTHIAPTVEGGGSPGRWADVGVDDDEPWAFRGRGATNLLPVIEAYDKVVVLLTELSD
jgi:hypothetical protein